MTNNLYEDWHSKLSHISAKRYNQIANIRVDIPELDPTIQRNMEFIPYLSAKNEEITYVNCSKQIKSL